MHSLTSLASVRNFWNSRKKAITVKQQPVFTNSIWLPSSIPGPAGAAAHLTQLCNPGLGMKPQHLVCTHVGCSLRFEGRIKITVLGRQEVRHNPSTFHLREGISICETASSHREASRHLAITYMHTGWPRTPWGHLKQKTTAIVNTTVHHQMHHRTPIHSEQRWSQHFYLPSSIPSFPSQFSIRSIYGNRFFVFKLSCIFPVSSESDSTLTTTLSRVVQLLFK